MTSRDRRLQTGCIILLICAVLGPASAVAQPDAGAAEPPAVVPRAAVDPFELYAEGWSAERLLDETKVVGTFGEEVGTVEDIIIGPDGGILTIIAEIGGFLDIGDTHVSVPWAAVELSQDLTSVAVPVTEDNIEDYSPFGPWGHFFGPEAADEVATVQDDLEVDPGFWKATDVIGDYALLEGRVEFGYVDDLIFDRAGELKAIIVEPDAGFGAAGPYAYPFYGFGEEFDPGRGDLELPTTEDEIADLEPFDYERLDEDEPDRIE